MPDPISRAIEPTFFSWDRSLPHLLAQTVSGVAQYGIVVAVLVVGLGALWAATRSSGAWLPDTLLRLAPGILAVGIALGIAHVAGLLLPETRPFVLLGQPPLFPHAPDASFPSDHVSGGMAMLGARVGTRTRALTVAIVVAVGLARVIAGVHWLDDIVGAAVLGLVLAWGVTLVWSAAVSRLALVRPRRP
ncbi:MAG: phosphatase PAP2 family protein [Candidatus Limnocylindrales bacterium]